MRTLDENRHPLVTAGRAAEPERILTLDRSPRGGWEMELRGHAARSDRTSRPGTPRYAPHPLDCDDESIP